MSIYYHMKRFMSTKILLTITSFITGVLGGFAVYLWYDRGVDIMMNLTTFLCG